MRRRMAIITLPRKERLERSRTHRKRWTEEQSCFGAWSRCCCSDDYLLGVSFFFSFFFLVERERSYLRLQRWNMGMDMAMGMGFFLLSVEVEVTLSVHATTPGIKVTYWMEKVKGVAFNCGLLDWIGLLIPKMGVFGYYLVFFGGA